jgi:hypothetical protein
LYDARQSTEFPNELEVQREDGPDDPWPQHPTPLGDLPHGCFRLNGE